MNTQGEKYINIRFMTEKMEGHGEDAPPLLIIKENAAVVGVFDGMGGAGATICDSEFGEDYTKAYVASRIVKKEIESIFEDCLGKEHISPEVLKDRLTKRLKQEQDKYPPKTKSMLRSKLVRDYPTTMAVIAFYLSKTELHINSYWAGDSRCYLWTRDGFFQITKDDLGEDNDPLENLRNDAAISNCICADRDFRINHNQITLSKEEPTVILSVTDGCFGYFPTPMHFEDMLKRCLRKAKDKNDWQNRVEQEIQKITGDDTSLSLIGIGFKSFGDFKKIANKSVPIVKKLKEIEDDIENYKRKLFNLQREKEQIIKNGWESYKKNYMQYLNKENDANA